MTQGKENLICFTLQNVREKNTFRLSRNTLRLYFMYDSFYTFLDLAKLRFLIPLPSVFNLITVDTLKCKMKLDIPFLTGFFYFTRFFGSSAVDDKMLLESILRTSR